MARSARAFFSPIARVALLSSMAALACSSARAAAVTRTRMNPTLDPSGVRQVACHCRRCNKEVASPQPGTSPTTPQQ